MTEAARLRIRPGVHWLDYVFDDETSAAQTTEQIFPAVHVFQRTRLAMLTANDCRQRSLAIIRLDELVTSPTWPHVGLQAGRLFVLTDVEPARRSHARDLAVHTLDVGHVAGAYRLNYDVEFGGRQH